MKDEKKYYTPTIEEFHINFEYEINTLYPEQYHDGYGFVKTSITKENWHLNMDVVSLPQRARVKYLDREDIESLGWGFNEEGSDNVHGSLCFNFSGINEKSHSTFGNYSLILTRTIWVLIFLEGATRFCGTIRNKSELRRLMQQLGILDYNTEGDKK